jgi:hypothetical protein
MSAAKKTKKELIHVAKAADRKAFASKVADAVVEEALREVDRLRKAAGKPPLKD